MSASSSKRPTRRATAANTYTDDDQDVFEEQQLQQQLELSDETDSQDEWRPTLTSTSKGKKRARTATGNNDEDSQGDEEEEQSQRAASSKKRGKAAAGSSDKARRRHKTAGSQRQKQRRRPSSFEDDDDAEMAELTRLEREREDEEERAEAADEAKQLWEAVRARRQEAAAEGGGGEAASAIAHVPPAPKEPPSIVAALAQASGSSQAATGKSAAVSLGAWLGASQSLEPTASDAAVVLDRDSLFIGFVFDLTSSAERRKLVTHLARVIHPRIPTSLFPTGLRHVQANKRGATHNMYAYRTLTLKPGKDGSEGPEAFGTEEGEDDDGEKGGAKAIARAIRSVGGSDCLVVVSRWYGGTMLGPVRFQHIETCAREALKQHMLNENLAILRQHLTDLDAKIATIRAQITPGSSAATPTVASDTDVDKLQRLVLARQKQLAMLEKKLAQSSSATTSSEGGAAQQGQLQQKNLEDMDAAQRALAILPP